MPFSRIKSLSKNDTVTLDPKALGLKVGLEIHQQLATRSKLFCNCRSIDSEKYEYEFRRRLRPTQSEMGEYDSAALFEFKKGRVIKYLANRESSCLVEADEEPPHDINPEALETALIIALALNSNIVDEVHVMRKIVIDGSNTTGFQRTMLIAMGGMIDGVKVQGISLEEDAAKLVSDDASTRTYTLDRLGVPLIEISLEPITGSADEVMKVALDLGRLLRASRRVARGLGTIRQDVNISISGGSVIEVKGVQRLEELKSVIEYEMRRQHALLIIAEELRKKGIREEDVNEDIIDVSNIFTSSKSKILRKALDDNGVINALKLKGFAGMLSYEPYEGIRLGRELGELVRFYGLGGIFHSDELPAYGITDDDVKKVRDMLKMSNDDAFILAAGKYESVNEAMKAIIARVKYALKGVPPETRAATKEGKTVYSRPRPGAARMYPETDIPPIVITDISSLRDKVPRSWDEYVNDLSRKYNINSILAEKVFDSEYFSIFEEVAQYRNIAASFIASVLTETILSLERSGLDSSRLKDQMIIEAFKRLDSGLIAKESIVSIFEAIMKGEAESVEGAIEKLGLKSISDKELESILDDIIKENRELIREKRMGAFSILMGKAMGIVRGKVDGQKVSTLLKRKIEMMG